jgi:hypothetical protein
MPIHGLFDESKERFIQFIFYQLRYKKIKLVNNIFQENVLDLLVFK